MARLIGDAEASRDAARTAPSSMLPPMLCIGAGPLFRPFAEALAPACHFHSVPTPSGAESLAIATMEDLAARIVPAIQASHPHGPLTIAGWSLAGVVAIEVAAQLERAGRDVRAVILFDTLSPVRQRQWFASAPRLRQWQLNLVKAAVSPGRGVDARGRGLAALRARDRSRCARAAALRPAVARVRLPTRMVRSTCRSTSGPPSDCLRPATLRRRCGRGSSWCVRNARNASRCSRATSDGPSSGTRSSSSSFRAIMNGCSHRPMRPFWPNGSSNTRHSPRTNSTVDLQHRVAAS